MLKLSTLVMGILNVTPDSFSDGGLFISTAEAVKRAQLMASEGADIIDIGGESTRPGAEPVSAQEEMARVIPVLQQLNGNISARLSIDTTKAEVAEEALKWGVTLINDISGGQDVRMVELVKKPGVEITLMHMRGTPSNMQVLPLYANGVVEEVKTFLTQRVNAFVEAGVAKEKLWIDPGIGFGKNCAHNLTLLRRLEEFQDIGGRILVGTSRKSFLAHVLGNPNTSFEEREEGTIASNLWAYSKGASVFRVHNVAALRRALQTWESIESDR